MVPTEPHAPPPPAPMLAEPSIMPPPVAAFEPIQSVDVEAAGWFDQKFTLNLFGKRLGASAAKKLFGAM